MSSSDLVSAGGRSLQCLPVKTAVAIILSPFLPCLWAHGSSAFPSVATTALFQSLCLFLFPSRCPWHVMAACSVHILRVGMVWAGPCGVIAVYQGKNLFAKDS